MRGITTPKKHPEYDTQVRDDFLRLQSQLPATSFVWHWVKGLSSEDSREARDNARADKQADIGAEEEGLRPRMPQMPRSRLLQQAESGAPFKAVVICPNSTYALNHVRGITTPKKHPEYDAQVRDDFLRLQSQLPAISFV